MSDLDSIARWPGSGSPRRVRAAWPLALAAVLLLASCGDDDPPHTASDGPPDLATLAAIEDPAALDAALEAWPISAPDVDAETARTVLTWRLRRHAATGAVERAGEDLALLRSHFGGEGRTPEGRRLPDELLAEGLAEAALEAARERAEGAEPDREGAERAVALAEQLDEGELADRIAGTRRWCLAAASSELGLTLPAASPPTPRAVLLIDAFAVGPASALGPQWARWRSDAPDAALEVVPLARGFTMAGVRRVSGATREEEVAALRTALEASDSTFHTPIDGESFARNLGLPATASACLLLAADGTIVARLAGPHLDLQRLEGAWERLRLR